MWNGTLPGTTAANEPSACTGNLAVARLAVELGGAEHVDAALFTREALEQADLDDAARRQVALMSPSDES